jgi:uncharacterized membrane protein YgdD (TMEM256/DUF423 family)
MEAPTQERELFWGMRWILWIGGGFVLLAGIQLFIFADRTDELFAWTIEPPATAALLGAFYWAAAVLAFMSAVQPTWARARIGVPGVLAFIWLTLVLTLIHIDRFHLDEGDLLAQVAAWVWLVIYVLEPPALLWAFVVQLRLPGGDPPGDEPLPGRLRALIGLVAVVLCGFGAALFVAPLDVGDLWPWELTALTGRAVAAWLVAVGLMLVAIGWEDHRTRVRPGMALLVTLAPLAVVGPLLFSDGVHWGSASMVAYLAVAAPLGGVRIYGWWVLPRTSDDRRHRAAVH